MTKKFFVIIVIAVIGFCSVSFAQDHGSQQSEAELNAQRHAEDVARGKRDWAILAGKEDHHKEPAWVAAVEGNGGSDPTCALYERSYYGDELRGMINKEYIFPGPVSFSEIGTTPEEFRAVFWGVSLATAKGLLQALRTMPKNSCGEGEGQFDLNDPATVAQRMTEVMEDAKLSPKDIGTTSEVIRVTLVSDGKKLAEELNKLPPKSDEASDLHAKLGTLIGDYNISAGQLGLTVDQITAITE